MKKLLLFLITFSFFANSATNDECRAKPSFDGVMSGVYKESDDYFVLLEGCIYRMSGVSIGIGEGEDTRSGTWTPVSSGSVGDGSYGSEGSGGGSESGSGSSGFGGIVSGQTVKLPDPVSSVSMPSGVLQSDTIGTAFPVWANNNSMTGSGYYLGSSADSVALYSILNNIKTSYNQPDMIFNQTDSFGHTVNIISNSYKAVSFTVNKKIFDTVATFEYVVTTHTKRYDTSNICTWPSQQNDWKIQCDESRAILLEDSYSTPSYYQTAQVIGNPNYNGGSTGGGSTGGGSTGGGSTGGGSGTGDFDYSKMANANKDVLTEHFDSSSIQSDVTSSLDATSKSISDSANSLSDSVSGLLGNGSQIAPEFSSSASGMQKIGRGDKSPLLESFTKGGLFPSLPSSKQCTPFVFASGKTYEFSISCQYIDMFKSVFAFILYFWTFVSVYDSFTGILRKGKY